MYSNIGGKLKVVAVVVAIAGALSCIIIGITLIDQASGYYGLDALAVPGWLLVIGGPVLFWINSFILFGFGELIQRTQQIHELLLHNGCSVAAGPRRTWKCKTCGNINDSMSAYCAVCGRQ